MQTGQHHFGGPASHQFEADMTALFPSHDNWQSAPSKRGTSSSTNRLGLSIPNFPTPQDQYLFVSDIRQPEYPTTDTKPSDSSPLSATSSGYEHRMDLSGPSSLGSFSDSSVYSTRPSFTAMNRTSIKMQDSYPISPMQTRFEGDHSMYDSNNSYSAGGNVSSATYPNFGQWTDMPEQASPGHMHHRMSLQSEGDAGPYTTGRRRKSENVEPGSARAIYLEKNRKAASKCRTKQKRQQEDLVEAARDQERRNKVLKSEVEILKSDLRDLMEMVGAHNECPDTRLRRYIQLEADRLAARGDKSPVADLLSPKGSSRGSGSPL